MKKYPYNYLGICITNKDPEYRGRVKIFIPSVMPALYESWNDENADITLECIGDNLVNGLDSTIVERLEKILPWAECASPIIGSSVGGQYSSQSTGGTGQFNQNTNGPDPGVASRPTGILPGVASNADPSKTIVSASGTDGTGKTTVTYADGTTAVLTGPRPIRNNNPGNLEFGPFARSQGAVGSDGRYAVFPTPQVGQQAKINLLKTGTYQRLTIGDAFNRYAPPSENPNYLRDLRNYTGFDLNRGMSSLSDAEFNTLVSAVAKIEGFGAPVDINDPTSPPDTGAIGSVTVPFNAPDGNPTYTVPEDPGQPSVQTQGAASQGVPGGSGSGTSFDSYFNSSAFRRDLAARGNSNPTQVNGSWKSKGGKGATLCAAGALITAGAITNSSSIKTATVGSATNLANSSSNALTRSGLYNKQVFPSNYTPQNGDVVAMAGGRQGYGHALTYLNGKWYAHKSGDLSPSQYLASGKYRSPALYRLTPEGITAMQASGVADGSIVYPGDPAGVPGEDIAGEDMPRSTTMIQHPTPTQAVPIDTTGMAQGMFVYPNPGALLWVFFREGDPMFPVYFAASYGQSEWQSAYQAGSAPLYYPADQDDPNKIVNKTVMRFNAAGLLEANGTVAGEQDLRTLTLAHANGAHLKFHPTGSIHYSPNEHLEQVAGNKYSYRLNNESWTQGVDNKVVLGNQFIKVGNPSENNLEVIEQLQAKIKEVNDIMLQS